MILRIIYIIALVIAANLPVIIYMTGFWMLIVAGVVGFILCNLRPSSKSGRLLSKRLAICNSGCELLKLFAITLLLDIVVFVMGMSGKCGMTSFADNHTIWIWNIITTVVVEAVIFWNGIIRVYITSEQLGIRWRVLGIVCGWIPIAHLIMLGRIIQVVSAEVVVENEKIQLNRSRQDQRICQTKYPILLVHGVFFRDFRYMNYWGRIPKQLEDNGATVYYGQQQSAASVADCGAELAHKIQEIVDKTGCDKVNIIAHSKGGLDSRYALTLPGVAEHVASLTTINTPHRGCEFADYLLSKIPEKQKNLIADTYNTTLKKLGDPDPDFLEAVGDLTAQACKTFNEQIANVEGVYYQSVGSKLNIASGGRFPLNFSYQLVKLFDGANDGLVGEDSFPWGERFEFLTVKGKRGISHGDMIDLNRENFKEFDVREFFVELVADLKQRGF